MRPDQIEEGKCYGDGSGAFYFRRVEAVWVRRGRKRVAWNTDGFRGRDGSGTKTRGVCYLDAFARWAKEELKEAHHGY